MTQHDSFSLLEIPISLKSTETCVLCWTHQVAAGPAGIWNVCVLFQCASYTVTSLPRTASPNTSWELIGKPPRKIKVTEQAGSLHVVEGESGSLFSPVTLSPVFLLANGSRENYYRPLIPVKRHKITCTQLLISAQERKAVYVINHQRCHSSQLTQCDKSVHVTRHKVLVLPTGFNKSLNSLDKKGLSKILKTRTHTKTITPGK